MAVLSCMAVMSLMTDRPEWHWHAPWLTPSTKTWKPGPA